MGQTELHGHNGDANSQLDEQEMSWIFSSSFHRELMIHGHFQEVPGCTRTVCHEEQRAEDGKLLYGNFPWTRLGLKTMSRSPNPWLPWNSSLQRAAHSKATVVHLRLSFTTGVWLIHTLVSLRGQDCLRPSLGWSSAGSLPLFKQDLDHGIVTLEAWICHCLL